MILKNNKNMLKKILYSLIISLVIAIIGSQLLEKKMDKRWKLVKTYTHIDNEYNLEWDIFVRTVGFKSTQMYTKFINELDNTISFIDNKNPCGDARGNDPSPKVLVSLNNINLMQIKMLNDDKKLILKCEQFIENEISKFEIYIKEYLAELFKLKILESSDSGYNKQLKLTQGQINFLRDHPDEINPLTKVLADTLKEVLKNNKTTMTKEAMEKLEQAFSLYSITKREITDLTTEDYTDLKFIYNFEIIKSDNRSLTFNKQSNTVTALSLYFISQIILLLIIIFSSKNILKRKSIIRGKVFKFFKD